jgi:sialidase-1
VFVTSSDDHGQTWSERREITVTVSKPEWIWYASGPVHATQLTRGAHAGRLLIPCDHNLGEGKSSGSHLVYSDDHGVSWKRGAVDTHAAAAPVHPDECVAVELVDGRIYVNTRDQNGSNPATRAIAYSSDGGETFDAPFAAEPKISSPVVQNSLLRFAARDQGAQEDVLIYSGPGDPKTRRDLTVRVSRDEAKTWEQATVIHAGPAAYCDLVKLNDREFGVLYEAGNKLYDEILFAAVGMDDLAESKPNQ